jgi:hypothetical protein
MQRSTIHRSSRSRSRRSSINLTRRELLAGAGAGGAALLLEQGGVHAQATPVRTVIFSHTTVVAVDALQSDVALAVEGDKIVAIGPTDQILKTYPNAEVYDGRGKEEALRVRNVRDGAIVGVLAGAFCCTLAAP